MKLSIITINYNNAIDLAKTINSVITQSWRDFEYLIIDGYSTDNSVEIIKEYESELAYWVSEPDNGIYHAMNKGVVHAKGEYLLMLNAGDFLCDNDVLKRVFALAEGNEDILLGNVYRLADGKVFQESYYSNKLSFDFFRETSISHQGAFIKKSLHDVVGYYDETFTFSSDWKFFILAICKYNVHYKHLPVFIANCDCGGLTWNPKNFPAIKLEMKQVMEEHFSAFLEDYEKFDSIRNKALKKLIPKAWNNGKSLLKRTIFKRYFGNAV